MQNDEQAVGQKYRTVAPFLNERARRIWAAAEARAIGWGGITLVAKVTGLSTSTVRAGLRETNAPVTRRKRQPSQLDRARDIGAGRKKLTDTDPDLLPILLALVEPSTRGDPMSPLRWTSLSLAQLSTAMRDKGHPASAQTIARMLHEIGYSLQGNRKSQERNTHPDRDKQFIHISEQVKAFQAKGQPVISIDTKKKELVGNFKNGGREWRPKGMPETVNVHDFRDDSVSELGGKAIPYGVYDLTANAGWVNVGIDHDTPDFAVQSIRSWWSTMGREVYPNAETLLIMADCGGSNSYRARAWKAALQRFAEETRMRISVCHFPPGTSKWNKIEHRMFCHITQNWRSRPLISHEVIVNLIGKTTTTTGLKITAALDVNAYPTGVKISDLTMAQVNLQRADFHGEWNYEIRPSPQNKNSCIGQQDSLVTLMAFDDTHFEASTQGKTDIGHAVSDAA